MPKKVSRFLSCFISLLLLLTMVACNSTTTGTTDGNEPAVTPEKAAEAKPDETDKAQPDTEDGETPDPLGKYDPPITISSIRYTLADNVYPAGDSVTDNAYTRFLYDNLGVTIEYDFIVDNSQWDVKVSTMLASQSYPDAFAIGGANFIKLAKAGVLKDLTEMYETYASPGLKARDALFPEGHASGVVDGKLLGIASLGWGTIDYPRAMWIREDWLAQSGKEAPTTMNEFKDLMKTFMEQHPGSHGFAMQKDLYSSTLPLFNIFDAFPTIWLEKDGKLEYGGIQPEVRDALLFLQELYADGYMDKEFGVKDTNKTTEDCTNGKTGIAYSTTNAGFWQFLPPAQNDIIFVPHDIPSLDGNLVTQQGSWPVSSFIVVNEKAKNPEAVIKVMNLYVENVDAGTFAAQEFREVASNSYGPLMQTKPNSGEGDYLAVSHALETGDTSALDPSQNEYYIQSSLWMNEKDLVTDANSYGRYMQMGPTGGYSFAAKYVNDGRVLLDRRRGPHPEEFAKVSSTLSTLQLDAFTNIIMGAPIEEFDTFVENWLKLGGEAATVEMNEVYG